ncbi:LPS export ABC transporter permease LptG [Parasulfitobacter algicola]|uniref:LPS export ABC transporter permease LptG n=1 Tax=Parasulfitobacter algicola TaxID=2614809 RepID=A0ABX2IYU5_9RHOB|nr:LPS export ABC transporter permease LptG [Sulfitobacter algicola]NSX55723.1 LPS export ABC transporter permease LptG [Sulfitobacter algicola]
MKLHLYFARKFIMSFLIVLGVFFAMLALLDLVEQLRRFDTDEVGLPEIVQLTLLNVPTGLYRILPLIVILATLMLFLSLARSSEMVVTRASGRSAMRSLISPVIVALLLGGVALAAFNPIVAATQKQYELKSQRYSSGEESVLSVSSEGLWLRQGSAQGQTVIRASRANLDGTILQDVTFITFTSDGTPTRRIEAAEAQLQSGAWLLLSVKDWRLDSGENPEGTSSLYETLDVETELTRDSIQDSFGTPSAIPIWELPSFIAALERAGFAANQHRMWFQMELAMPLLLVAMVLVGAGFTMRHTRFGRTGLMVLMAVMMGFGLYIIRNFAQIMGESGQIPILLAAWAPPISAICLSLGLLFHLEDG